MNIDNPRSDYVHKSQLRDFGGIGVTDGTRVGGRRRPNTYTRASACVSYKLDADGNPIGAHVFRSTRTTTRKPTTKQTRPSFDYWTMAQKYGTQANYD